MNKSEVLVELERALKSLMDAKVSFARLAAKSRKSPGDEYDAGFGHGLEYAIDDLEYDVRLAHGSLANLVAELTKFDEIEVSSQQLPLPFVSERQRALKKHHPQSPYTRVRFRKIIQLSQAERLEIVKRHDGRFLVISAVLRPHFSLRGVWTLADWYWQQTTVGVGKSEVEALADFEAIRGVNERGDK